MLEDFRLRVFLTVAETGSFTGAARQLGISQPAVSQNITTLEKQVGATLFTRAKGDIYLTAEGRAFREYAARILYWYDAADAMFGAEGRMTFDWMPACGRRAVLTADAEKQMKQLEAIGCGNMPICVAKTQYSFSDDPAKLGAPEDFDVTVRSMKVSAGAGFIVALTGEIMTMPGLPKHPAAERIDIDAEGKISGLF